MSLLKQEEPLSKSVKLKVSKSDVTFGDVISQGHFAVTRRADYKTADNYPDCNMEIAVKLPAGRMGKKV